MYCRVLRWFILSVPVVSAASAAPAGVQKSSFVTTNGNGFIYNGSQFEFSGTNAYWLHALNTEADIDNTLANISAQGVRVVRTWFFNDVDTIPMDGTWFQLIANNSISINTGTNGLQKLDTVISLAAKHGLLILATLTNNWNPRSSINNDTGFGTSNQTLPRNTLSNDYGGMDLYVREFGKTKTHDEFYTNPTVMTKFMNYTTQIVSRYANEPTIFGWEIANDPRCNSTLPATPMCNTTAITQFHFELAQHIKLIDPNHMVASGNQGFLCTSCQRLFPIVNSTTSSGQSTSLGRAFDGSYGVDSEDILNIPQIAFGTFQLFPDQVSYEPDDLSLSVFDNIVNQGSGWIIEQAELALIYGKPMILNAFGLVTQADAPFFVPVNQSQAPFAFANQTLNSSFVTNDQRDSAYSQWIQVASQAGLNGIIQYQWTQANLTAADGTIIISDAAAGDTGNSPNDGYSNVFVPSLTISRPKKENHLRIIIGTSVGGALAVATLATVIFLLSCRRRKLALDLIEDHNVTVEPFWHGSLSQPKYGKNTKRQENIEVTNVAPAPLGDESEEPNNVSAPLVRGPRFRINIHEDSGEDITQPDIDSSTVVIDMPPTYTDVEQRAAARAVDTPALERPAQGEPVAEMEERRQIPPKKRRG